MHELEPRPHQANIIGIDLGTEFTTVTRFNESGRAEITNNAEGQPQTPSVIQIDESGYVIVGTEAKKLVGQGRENVFAEFKRDMGTDQVRQVGDRQITPEHLTAILLKKVVQDYTEQFGEPSTIAITWPANFREEQREATKSAARRAGLRNVFFIEEPTAMALFYANETPLNGKYVIFDLSQSTLDITLLDAAGVDIAIIYQGGIQHLGVKDIDRALLEIIKVKLEVICGEYPDLSEYSFSQSDLEKIRRTLSSGTTMDVKLVSNKHGPVIFKLTRVEFTASIQRLVEQAEMACDYALRCGQEREAGIVKKPDIKGVFMTGHGSNVPAFQALMKKMFGMNPQLKELEHSKALGAAIYAALKTDSGSLNPLQRRSCRHDSGITDVSPHFLGITYNDWLTGESYNRIIFPKGTAIPCRKQFTLTADAHGHLPPIRINQSAIEELNLDFVATIWEAEFPKGPAYGKHELSLGYHDDGTIFCRVVREADGQAIGMDLSTD